MYWDQKAMWTLSVQFSTRHEWILKWYNVWFFYASESLFIFECVVLEFQNSGGVIINITATLSVRGAALQTHAGTAKAAIGNILYIY